MIEVSWYKKLFHHLLFEHDLLRLAYNSNNNTSNYNSISSNLKENIRATIDELKDAQQSFKIVKNVIILHMT